MYRQMLTNFFALSARLEAARARIGALIGVSGPQWTMLMTIAECSPEPGIRASIIADKMNVSRPFVATETAKIIRAGLVLRRADPEDARSAMLTLTERGAQEIRRLMPTIQLVNDIGFSGFSRQQFQGFCHMLETLLKDSAAAFEAMDQASYDVPRRRFLGTRRNLAL